MTDSPLNGQRILVVEDEYLLADDLRDALAAAGAEIIGPLATVAEAIACIDAETAMDAAVLDVNLRGEMVFPVADALTARGVPIVFATGYDQGALPDRFLDVAQLGKPLKAQKIVAVLGPLLHRP